MVIKAVLPILFFGLLTSVSCNNHQPETAVNKAGDANKMTFPKDNGSTAEKSCLKMTTPEDSAKFVSKSLTVKGDVETELVLTVDSLKRMNVQTILDYAVVCQNGATMKVDKTCKGVLLKDILMKATLKQENHKDRNFYFVATATDDYKATFSWGEIFNNVTGDSTYVIYEENGAPIISKGDFILIVKNDLKTGPRHVFWLKNIEVTKVK